jgi:hypothetical protein
VAEWIDRIGPVRDQAAIDGKVSQRIERRKGDTVLNLIGAGVAYEAVLNLT